MYKFNLERLADGAPVMISVFLEAGTKADEFATKVQIKRGDIVVVGVNNALAPHLWLGSLLVKDGDGNVYGFAPGVEAMWIRNAGKIQFVCNDRKLIGNLPNLRSGHSDNGGSVKPVIEVWPRESSPQ